MGLALRIYLLQLFKFCQAESHWLFTHYRDPALQTLHADGLVVAVHWRNTDHVRLLLIKHPAIVVIDLHIVLALFFQGLQQPFNIFARFAACQPNDRAIA